MQSIPVDAVTNPRSVLATNTLKKIRGLALGTSSSPSESEPANFERSSLRDMVRCRGGEGNQLYRNGKLLFNNNSTIIVLVLRSRMGAESNPGQRRFREMLQRRLDDRSAVVTIIQSSNSITCIPSLSTTAIQDYFDINYGTT